jgi:hypothetical protein
MTVFRIAITISMFVSSLIEMVTAAGFEPTMFTTWVPGLQPGCFSLSHHAAKVRPAGFEPATSSLEGWSYIRLGMGANEL